MRLRARKDVSARQKFSAHQVGLMRRGKTDAKQGARCKIAFGDGSARVCAEITLLSNDTPQFRCRLPDKTVK